MAQLNGGTGASVAPKPVPPVSESYTTILLPANGNAALGEPPGKLKARMKIDPGMLEVGTARTTLMARSSDARWRPWVVAAAAMVMGLPALRGGFVGGDDHRLVLDHVLVNHPSLTHATELFRIVHRDLYQPLPLLTFQIEFAVANALGLTAGGTEGFAWLFHLTNVLLHALNAVLVFYLLRRFQAGLADRSPGGVGCDRNVEFVALAGALLFAIHPLQVEAVAWINGRMMLLSTLFVLSCVLAFLRFLDRPAWTWALIALLCAVFAGISKVRSGLPFLLIIAYVLGRRRFEKKTVSLWVAIALVTGCFAAINVGATSAADLFEEGAEHLKGPRLVRVVMALAWYFEHFVWPSGLASYYPTPAEVFWWSAATARAAMVVVIASGILFALSFRLRSVPWAMAWFLFGIGDTLPFFPARNVLAADRYMYLPIMGFAWISGEAICGVRSWLGSRTDEWRAKAILRTCAAGIAVALLGTGWRVAATYNNSLSKTYRVAEVFPDEPRVWVFHGWSNYAKGRYDEAIECAKKELRHDKPPVRSEALQLMAMSQLKLGNTQEALRLLDEAIVLDPVNTLGLYRLGMAYEELGRLREAIDAYEKAVATSPRSNPTIHRLAQLYVRSGRPAEARAQFENELTNNPYEVPAILSLAELEIAQRTPGSLKAAAERLRNLLEWMPENAVGHVNLGVALDGLGRRDAAAEEYKRALSIDPTNATAAVNLGQLFAAQQRNDAAQGMFAQAAKSSELTLEQALVLHDYFIDHDAVEQLAGLWELFSARHPEVGDAAIFKAWTKASVGDANGAVEALAKLGGGSPLQHMALAFAYLMAKHPDEAIAHVDALAAGNSEVTSSSSVPQPKGWGTHSGSEAKEARRRLLAALEFFDRRNPDSPWAFCLATPLLIADGQMPPAKVFLEECERRCGNDGACEYARQLRERLSRD